MKIFWKQVELFLTTLYAVIYCFAVSLLYLYTLTDPISESIVADRIKIVGAIVIIMGCPMWVDIMYRFENFRRWVRLMMALTYVFTVVILGICAISWFMEPVNSRWEPLTLILGFTASWITLLQQGWKQEDRILSIFRFGHTGN